MPITIAGETARSREQEEYGEEGRAADPMSKKFRKGARERFDTRVPSPSYYSP